MNKKAFLAGWIIGIGVIANLTAPSPLIGAILFSFGLLSIFQLKLSLYTGQIGFLFSHLSNINELLFILFYNLLGIGIVANCSIAMNPALMENFVTISEQKFAVNIINLLFKGFFCGMLVHLAVLCKQKSYLVIMAIIIFILIGSEHCIALFPFLLCNLSLGHIFKFIAVIIGNSLGALLVESFFIKYT